MKIKASAFRALLIVVSVWSLLVGSAAAAVVHEREGTFPLNGLSLLAVDDSGGPSAGSLYVAELNPAGFSTRVYQTDPSGTPTGVELSASETPAGSFGMINFTTFKLSGGFAVDGSTSPNAGYIYFPDIANGVIDVFDESGKYVCQITGEATPSASECAGATGSATPSGNLEPQSVAVDPSNGNVVVGDSSGILYEFNAAGEYVRSVTSGQVTEPFSIAVDSAGNLYVVNANPFGAGPGTAVKLNSAGAFQYAFPGTYLSVGVDLSNDHIYVGQGLGAASVVEEFDSAGSFVSRFGDNGAGSITVNEAGKVYLATSGLGEIWSADIFLPSVVTGAATGVEESVATLHGHIDPEVASGGTSVVRCEFEYGLDQSYGQTAPCSPSPSYSSPTDVAADLAGLQPSATYHYRLVAENGEGEAQGEDRTFTTVGPPGVSGQMAIARTHSATVKALIDPFGYATTCEVEYVDDATFKLSGYGSAASVPCADTVPAGLEGDVVSASLTGLQIGTIYHFRFVATNQSGTKVGDDSTFSTFGIQSFSVELLDKEGQPALQAGEHPYEMRVRLKLTTTEPETTRNPESVPANLKTVRVELPPGLIGNPTAVPQCLAANVKPAKCSGDNQVGFASIHSARGGGETGPVYNVVPPKGVAAQLSARFNEVGIARIDAGVRTGSDYGVNADSVSITALEGVDLIEMSIWGVPADEGHFFERVCRGATIGPCATDAPLRPFLTNPTSCLGPLSTLVHVDAWQDPGEFVSASSMLPGMVGCDRLDFSPELTVQPDTRVSDSSSGLHVDLHVPQNQNPVGLAEANLKDAVVKLPAGIVLNAAGASGLTGCSVGQVELHGPNPAACPDSSKVGTAEIHTPLLDHPVKGSVYLAQQGNGGAGRGSNPFGSLLAIYIALDDPQSGVVVKLAGQVEVDQRTGQLTTTFKENPQLPFEHLSLDFFGGPNAPLSTPITCGDFITASDLTPWTSPEGPDAHPQSSFAMDAGPGRGCVSTEDQQPNQPNLEAGTVSPLAGAYSPFVLNLTRADGTQRFSKISTTLPKGLLSKLKGVPYCSESAIAQAADHGGPGEGSLEQANPSCPAASKVGSVQVRAGTGSNPLTVDGNAYLAGSYKGAPLSLVIITPAVAGPFDLGTVVVRTALNIDPETLRIEAESDSLPTKLEGIPLNIRSISLQLDRPDFTINPTSCARMAVGVVLTSTSEQLASSQDRFQVAGCRGLSFAPKLSLHVFGKTQRNGKPRLRAVLTTRPGEANIARARVNLPRSEFLEQAHIRTVCTRVQFAKGRIPGEKCPQGSIYGKAKAWTPLLDKRLEGPVFLRSSSNPLPDLVATLNGQVNVVLAGRIDTGSNGGLRTSFEVVPDAPVSKFVLEMQGGKKGLLVNSTNICKGKHRAIADFRGQNGRRHLLRPVVKAKCKR